jgi:DNA topoisomerase I
VSIPRAASRLPCAWGAAGQRRDAITLDEALELTKLPRELGQTGDGVPLTVNIGRFGPYVRYADKYVSLGKDDDPYTITIERAVELIEEKKRVDAARYINEFPEVGIKVLNGRYGPYITDGVKNARVPKDVDPKQLSVTDCQALLASAPNKRPGRRTAARRN